MGKGLALKTITSLNNALDNTYNLVITVIFEINNIVPEESKFKLTLSRNNINNFKYTGHNTRYTLLSKL